MQRLHFPINLLRPAIKKEAVLIKALPIAITAIRINPKVALVAFLVIFLTLGWGWRRRLPLENELKAIRGNQPKIEGISGEQSSLALAGLEREITNKLNIMESVVKNRFYLTEAMDIIPRLMPRGAWLSFFSFRGGLKDKLEFSLEGVVFLGDSDKEYAAVDDLILGLKNNPKFSRSFKDIVVVSMEKTELARLKLEVTKFVILCR